MEDDNKEWTPENHLIALLSDGEEQPCDSGNASEINLELPPWFDLKKCQRGQRYFKSNIFSMLLGKLCGLLTVMAVPSSLRILVFTGRSCTSLKAYRRYVSTILHTTVWYNSKLDKNSRAWKSLEMIRRRHLLSSQSASRHGIGIISQKDMVLTQFGFMGYILIRPKMLGIHNTNREDREAFVHLWRTIGHVLGIDDRYNLCRASLEETEYLCNYLLDTQLRTNFLKTDPVYNQMSAAFLDGMWPFNPAINYGTFMFFTKRLMNLEDYHYSPSQAIQEWVAEKKIENNNYDKKSLIVSELSDKYKDLNLFSKVILLYLVVVVEILMKFTLIRWFFNYLMLQALFLIEKFPFLAFYKFEYKKSFIDIRVDIYKEKID